MPNLAQVREEMTRISHELHEVMAEAGPNVDLEQVRRLSGTTAEKAAWMKQQHQTLSELGAQCDELENLQKIGQLNEGVWRKQTEPVGGFPMPGGGNGNGSKLTRQRSLAELITENVGYKELLAGRRTSVTIDIPVTDFKALVTLSNISPQADRLALQNMGLETRTVADLPLQSTTDRSSLEYYEETTLTQNATMIAEGGTKTESGLGWTLRAEPIRKAATFIPATDEVLADNGFLEGQIRGRLTYMVQRLEEAQILSGSGVAPQLLGFLARTIQTTAKGGTEPNPDAIYRAMQLVRGSAGTPGVGFAEPTAIVMHPTNWSAIALLKTADGLYIWGHPSDVGPDRLWGKEVRQTTAIPVGTALVGAFRPHSEVVRRAGITVTLSTEHATNFIENKVTILAESRLGLCVYRPSAFCSVTSLG